MTTFAQKKIEFKIGGLGSLEIYLLDTGEKKWLKEIEEFVSCSEERFIAIAMANGILRNNLHYQRVIQAFVNHIQAGGEFQPANAIRKHFSNWIRTQSNNLKTIVSSNGTTSTENNGETLRSAVQDEFARRYANR